ncbi:uncharacterized protein LOC6563141 [Drosophila grimshawi]|uniref:GH18209 n=1 Tax=Drosophila grimshawi TaxID=7222 RepID=B4JFT4_DROGR|nr:uncharacterized protein LOC6563141 [Drosophila grimshawi]EDV93565.1 GH18209 [Drosophila grimshawi]
MPSLSGNQWGLALVCLLLGLLSNQGIYAQDDTTTTSTISTTPAISTTESVHDTMACNVSTSMALDLEKFSGIWWEITRQPVGSIFCTKINVTVLDKSEDNVLIDTTYSNTIDYPYVNQTMNATLTVADKISSTEGYNFTYWNPPDYTPHTVFKVLDTDYSQYAVICGYTNATDNSTAFGMIIARDRTLAPTVLDTIESESSALYDNFFDGTMTLTTQGSTCYSGADPSTTSTVLYAIFAIVIYLYTK